MSGHTPEPADIECYEGGICRLSDEVHELRAVNADLLAALKNILKNGFSREAEAQAAAAIAKATVTP